VGGEGLRRCEAAAGHVTGLDTAELAGPRAPKIARSRLARRAAIPCTHALSRPGAARELLTERPASGMAPGPTPARGGAVAQGLPAGH